MGKQEEQAALAASKLRLIREGELYRLGVLQAKYHVANALHPDRLLHGAVDQAVGAVQNRLGNLVGSLGGAGGLGGGLLDKLIFRSIKSLAPYALTVGSFIMRRRLLKPALAVAAVAAAGAAYLMNRKSNPNP
jgi:hypothetical protein